VKQSDLRNDSPPIKDTSVHPRSASCSHRPKDSLVVNSSFLGTPADDPQ